MLRRLLDLPTLFLCLLLAAAPALRAAEATPQLVDAAWLQRELAAGDLLLLDASPGPLHAAGHIAGAVPVEVFAYAGREMPPALMQQFLRRWGVSPGRRIVVYDQGGQYMAPRLFFDLYYLGFPLERLFLLDGGLSAWRAAGGAVSSERTPPPAPGSFEIGRLREEARVRLDEFLVASGDPARNALVDALEPGYHYGQAKFFDRAGHVPHAVSLPAEDFFRPDKTFKSPEEIRRMALYRGIRPEMTVHAHCGGGGAAAVPFFALRFLAGYPKVKLYNESQREWLADDRELPFWTYAQPQLLRNAAWLQAWNGGMLRAFGLAQLSVIDVREPAAYAQGHLPYAVNLPAASLRALIEQPARLASALGEAGVNPAHEAIVVADGAWTPSAALAFWVLERAGQRRVSLLSVSVDEWGLAGHPLTKETTLVGPRRSPQDLAVPAVRYETPARTGLLLPASGAAASQAVYPRVYLAAAAPAATPAGQLVTLDPRTLLNAEGTLKPAKDLLALFDKAGLPRYAEVVCIGSDPGQAALLYVALRLMGWPDVKLQLA